MKRLIILLCLLSGVFTEAGGQSASVGINTEDPRGVLHIDGGATASQTDDDVLIDAAGQLGVGHQNPATKVDIRAAEPGGALRIQDTTEGQGRALTSEDDYGTGSWKPLPKPSGWRQWFAFLSDNPLINYSSGSTYPIKNYANSLISSASLGGIDKTAGTISVPFTGKYLITIFFSYYTQREAPSQCQVILYVAHSGSSTKTRRYTPSAWIRTTSWGEAVSFWGILDLIADDVLSLDADVSLDVNAHISNLPWYFGAEFLQP